MYLRNLLNILFVIFNCFFVTNYTLTSNVIKSQLLYYFDLFFSNNMTDFNHHHNSNSMNLFIISKSDNEEFYCDGKSIQTDFYFFFFLVDFYCLTNRVFLYGIMKIELPNSFFNFRLTKYDTLFIFSYEFILYEF